MKDVVVGVVEEVRWKDKAICSLSMSVSFLESKEDDERRGDADDKRRAVEPAVAGAAGVVAPGAGGGVDVDAYAGGGGGVGCVVLLGSAAAGSVGGVARAAGALSRSPRIWTSTRPTTVTSRRFNSIRHWFKPLTNKCLNRINHHDRRCTPQLNASFKSSDGIHE